MWKRPPIHLHMFRRIEFRMVIGIIVNLLIAGPLLGNFCEG